VIIDVIVVIINIVVVVFVFVLIIVVINDRGAIGGDVADGVLAIAQRGDAIFVGGLHEVVQRHAGRQFDDVLWPHGADDRVVPAIGTEDDAVGGTERGNIDDIIPGIAINGDGVEPQAGAGEVPD